MSEVGLMPYTAVNGMLDEGSQAGNLNYWKSSFLDELSDDAIDTMVALYASCPSPMSGLLLEHFHGQATRVADDDETGDDPVRSAYGPNYDRLVQAKTRYDPTNLFHLNINIKPAT